MRKVMFTIIIGLFFGLLFAYLVNNTSPWNEPAVVSYLEKYDIARGEEFDKFVEESIKSGIIFDFLNVGNLFILSIIGAACFASIFAAIHMIIDKLFFKRFWQEPDQIVALRRGFWVPIIYIIFSLIRLLGGLTSVNLGFIVFVIVVITYIEVSFTRSEIQRNKEIVQNKEINSPSKPYRS